MAQAHVNSDILSWARNRARLSTSALAEKLHVKEEKLQGWEAGEEKPTFRQAQEFAHHTHIPFGYLFLNTPPADELPIPDLRTIGSHGPLEISLDLRDTVREVLRRQLWYREYQIDQGRDPVAVVGSVTLNMSVMSIVENMRSHLGVGRWPDRGRWDAYFNDLLHRIESLGILVMRSSMVGSNTRRILSVKEFRGFAIADGYAPVVFINTSDCPEARLFTLLHELTHIWLGESGVSDGEHGSHRKVEKICNAVAAEFLVPEDEFKRKWNNSEEWHWNVGVLASHFHVSQWVSARRAMDLGYIDSEEYQAFISQRHADYKAIERDGAPRYGLLQTLKVSKRLAMAVTSEALSGRILLRDAGQLIGIKPHKLAEYARQELGI
ncbi:XRE family transcriptional regulator [Chromobacterium amazonense]|uniref:XRE family transcriptional regulator n=1 Tax=Chromobacterium amazonense TaxID=1382803 RepID=A0ABU8UZP8_9NEIS|nr:XRE family transcriptional regulator [Chromobacterium amazonense]MDQ4539075.1 XRE family transcriptional regulator [Chromobacterium amazonense]